MLLALPALPGVGLIVIVVVLARPRWVSRQRGAVKGAIRVAGGDVPGLRAKCKRRYGRWVCEILVWTGALLLSCNKLVAAARGIASAALTGCARRPGYRDQPARAGRRVRMPG